MDLIDGDFFSAVIDAAPDGMLIIDADGTITFANREAVAIFGLPIEDLVGSSVEDLLPEGLRRAHRAHRHDYRAEPEVRPMGVGMLLQARRGDGREFPVEVSLSPLVRGDEFHVVAAVRDVTARVEADAEMRRVLRTLDAAEQVMAIAEDRERIARDLHDTVIQRLFASGLVLQAVTSRVEPVVRARLDAVVDDLDQTIREIRSAIFSLQASGPPGDGLRGRLLDVVHQATENIGFEPRLQFDGAIETTDDRVAAQLIPTLREALTNVAKHAEATAVSVTVSASSDELRLTVVDDGVGVGEPAGIGHGLANLAGRAVRLGGTLVVEPATNARGDTDADQEFGGTRLVWTVPATPPEPDGEVSAGRS